EAADDVRAVQAPGGQELLLEALAQDAVVGDLGAEHLDGDHRAGVAVAALVDGAGRAPADLAEQVVFPDLAKAPLEEVPRHLRSPGGLPGREPRCQPPANRLPAEQV